MQVCILQKPEKQMALSISYEAFVCSLQAYSDMYTSCILRWSSICLVIMSLSPLRIYVIQKKVLELP